MTEVHINIAKSKLLKEYKIAHGFTQRSGGISKVPFDSLNTKKSILVPDHISNVASNIKSILDSEINVKNGVLLYLEGGSNVTTINQCSGLRTVYGYDGAVTKQKNCFLAITVADCLPILLVDRKSSITGIAHAGWKGSAGKITTKVIEQMIQLGANLEDTTAVIGPGICGDCYEVGKEVATKFDSKYVTEKARNKYLLDLVGANYEELKIAGVSEVDVVNICTFENTDKFYSARKDNTTGRFLAYISS